MALKAMREKLDGLSDEIKKEYEAKDGKFILSVTKTDGLGLENVDALKGTVEKLRASEKSLQVEVKTADDALKSAQVIHKEFVAKYDGIDATAAKDALGKIEDIKNWDGETKVKEAVQLAEQKVEARMQSKLDAVVEQNTTKVGTLEKDLADSQNQLKEAVVTTKIVEAISAEGGNAKVLMPHVRSHVVMVRDTHGKFKPEVQNVNGDPRIGGSDGADMTILQLVQEMKSQDTFAGCFVGANSSGTGKTGSEETTSTKKKEGTGEQKTVNASDTKAVSDSLEDIAAGKTLVNMTE